MAELGASTVRIIGGTYALAAETAVSMQAVLQILFEKKENDPLVKHLKAGGEIGSDVVIPRKMMKEFEEKCKEANIPFDFLERNRESEFVTVAYRDVRDHKINDYGEFDRTERDHRTVKHSDRGKIKEIEAKIMEVYNQNNAMDHAMTAEAFRQRYDNEMKMPITEISGLSEREMTILQQQFQKDWVDNTAVQKEDGTYSIFIKTEDKKRDKPYIPSKADLSIASAKLMIADPRINHFLQKEEDLNRTLDKAIDNHGEGMEGKVLAENINTDPASMEKFDKRNFVVYFEKEGNVTVSIKNGELLSEAKLNLFNEKDQETLRELISEMRSKEILPEVGTDEILKARAAYFNMQADSNIPQEQRDLVGNFRAREYVKQSQDKLAQSIIESKDLKDQFSKEDRILFQKGVLAEENLALAKKEFFQRNHRELTVEDVKDPSFETDVPKDFILHELHAAEEKNRLAEKLYQKLAPIADNLDDRFSKESKELDAMRDSFKKTYDHFVIDFNKPAEFYTKDQDAFLRKNGYDPLELSKEKAKSLVDKFHSEYAEIKDKADHVEAIKAEGHGSLDEQMFVKNYRIMESVNELSEKCSPMENLFYEDYCRAKVLDPKVAASTIALTDRVPNSDVLVQTVARITDRDNLLQSDKEVYEQIQENMEEKQSYMKVNDIGLCSMNASFQQKDAEEQHIDNNRVDEEVQNWSDIVPAVAFQVYPTAETSTKFQAAKWSRDTKEQFNLSAEQANTFLKKEMAHGDPEMEKHFADDFVTPTFDQSEKMGAFAGATKFDKAPTDVDRLRDKIIDVTMWGHDNNKDWTSNEMKDRFTAEISPILHAPGRQTDSFLKDDMVKDLFSMGRDILTDGKEAIAYHTIDHIKTGTYEENDIGDYETDWDNDIDQDGLQDNVDWANNTEVFDDEHDVDFEGKAKEKQRGDQHDDDKAPDVSDTGDIGDDFGDDF
jgi:hypothetical protein